MTARPSHQQCGIGEPSRETVSLNEFGDLLEHRQQIVDRHQQIGVDAPLSCSAELVLVVSPDAYHLPFATHIVNSAHDSYVQPRCFRDEYFFHHHFRFSPATGSRIHDDKSVAGRKLKVWFLHLLLFCAVVPRGSSSEQFARMNALPQQQFHDERREQQHDHQNNRPISNPVEMHVVSDRGVGDHKIAHIFSRLCHIYGTPQQAAQLTGWRAAA